MRKEDLMYAANWVYRMAEFCVDSQREIDELQNIKAADIETIAKEGVAVVRHDFELQGLTGFDDALEKKLNDTFVRTVLSHQACYKRYLHEYGF